MKHYTIDASETVFYTIEVEAKSEDDAREMVMMGDVIVPDAIDSSDFQIDSITETL